MYVLFIHVSNSVATTALINMYYGAHSAIACNRLHIPNPLTTGAAYIRVFIYY